MTEADSEEDDNPEPKVSWKDAAKCLAVFVKFAEQCAYMNTRDVMDLHCIQNEFLLQRGKSCKQMELREFMKVGGKANNAKSVTQNSDSQPRSLNVAIQNASVQPNDVSDVALLVDELNGDC